MKKYQVTLSLMSCWVSFWLRRSGAVWVDQLYANSDQQILLHLGVFNHSSAQCYKVVSCNFILVVIKRSFSEKCAKVKKKKKKFYKWKLFLETEYWCHFWSINSINQQQQFQNSSRANNLELWPTLFKLPYYLKSRRAFTNLLVYSKLRCVQVFLKK